MCSRRVAALAFLLAVAPAAASGATARVQYVSSASVYLDQGLTSGLVEGAPVTVKRDGKEIARLTATFVADHSAACRIESSTDSVRPGDVAVFTASAVPADTSGAAAPPSAPDSTRASPGDAWGGASRVHGRLSSFYTRTKDPNGTYENPSLFGDLRWTGKGLAQWTLRGRATRPRITGITDLPGVEVHESTLRVYEAQAGYRSGTGRLEMNLGRLLPRQLEGSGYTDGASLRWRATPVVAVGVSGGRSADLATAGLASGGLQLGGYVEMGSRALFAARRWHALIGGAFLSDSSLTRRQYLVQRADVTIGPGVSLTQSVEVDLNPRWKRNFGEPAVGWTAWSLGTNVGMTRRVSFAVSADSRRAVLVPEQTITTAPLVLDRFTGGHASTRVLLVRDWSLRVGSDVRRRERDGEIFTSWDAGVTGSRILSPRLSGGLHAMGYSGDNLSGVHGDANLVARLTSASQLDLAGGAGGTTTGPGATPTSDYRSQWARAGIDYRTPGGLGAAIAYEWRSGGPGNELSAELGFSF